MEITEGTIDEVRILSLNASYINGGLSLPFGSKSVMRMPGVRPPKKTERIIEKNPTVPSIIILMDDTRFPRIFPVTSVRTSCSGIVLLLNNTLTPVSLKIIDPVTLSLLNNASLNIPKTILQYHFRPLYLL